MDRKEFVIAALCIVAAVVLSWFHKDNAIAFLTLIARPPQGSGKPTANQAT